MFKWLVLLMTLLVQISFSFLNQGIGSVSREIINEFELTSGQYGFLASCLMIGPLAGLYIAGRLLDTYGEKRIVLLGAVTLSATLFITAFVNNFVVLCFFFTLSGLGYCVSQPGGSKAIVQWFDKKNRGLAMGIRQAGLPVSGGIAALVFPQLAMRYGWQSALIFSGSFVLLCGLIFYGLYREPTNPSFVEEEGLNDQSHGLKENKFILACLCGVVLVSVQSILTVFYIPLLHFSLKIPVVRAGQFYFVLQISGALGRIILASFSDKTGLSREKVTYLCMVFCSLSCVLFYCFFKFNMSEVFIFLMSFITGFFCYGWYGPWITWLAEIGPVQIAGARLGFAMSCNQVSIMVSPFLFGLISEYSAGGASNYWLISALVIMLFYFYLVRSEHSRSR